MLHVVALVPEARRLTVRKHIGSLNRLALHGQTSALRTICRLLTNLHVTL